MSTSDTLHAYEELAHGLPPGLTQRLQAAILADPDGPRTEVLAPFTGTVLFRHPTSTTDDVERAFERAREVQPRWARVPLRRRAEIIGRVHDEALNRQDELLDLLQLEAGKSRYDGFQELGSVPLYARYVSRMGPRLLAPRRRRGAIPLLTRAYERSVPKGVVGVVAAWNYPAVFAASDGFGAIMAGNTLVHRPDPQTALSAIWVRQLAIEAGLPEDVWQVVVGGPEIGQAVVDRADHVAFTGSTRVGRVVASQVAGRLAGLSLELGGKNPFVVLDDVKIPRTVDAVVRACFINAGQTCVGPERLIVADSIYEPFKRALIDRLQRMAVGPALSYADEMGSLISEKQLRTVERHVADAREQGATILAGGRPRPDLGPFFFEPTLIEGLQPGMLACTEETFGPVLGLYRSHSDEEAIALANDTDYGLHAVVWTGNTRRGVRVAARIKAGNVEVNDGVVASWASADLPQGGMKQSGLGRRNGAAGILRYTEPQGIAVQRLHGIHPPARVPAEVFAKGMTWGLKALHRTGLP